jgi:CheY-like chemotaxis protein
MSTAIHPFIFVVEDDRDILETVVCILEGEGYGAAGATDGREALDWLRAAVRPPCMILLDLMMPVLNGWQFRAEQLSDPRLSPIPVVVLSAAADLRQEAATLGAAGYLTKPFDFDQLLELAHRHCRQAAAGPSNLFPHGRTSALETVTDGFAEELRRRLF